MKKCPKIEDEYAGGSEKYGIRTVARPDNIPTDTSPRTYPDRQFPDGQKPD